MRLSRFFMPVLKENPHETEAVSHCLMLRAGMIRQEAQGSFSWLPLGKRVLDRVCGILKEEQDRAGAQEILMPMIQSKELWQKSGRYAAYGKEMLRFRDRHDREMIFGPTNEEMITEIFRSFVKSYRDLPLNLYQIHWKYRDEIRPRFGVMRSREFLMKDAYSFDFDEEESRKAYNRMFVSYLRIFGRAGLKPIPVRADTGPIGGDLSHEFVVLADTGESEIFCDHRFLSFDALSEKVDFEKDDEVEAIVKRWTHPYASTSEMHDTRAWEALDPEERLSARAIEVGHIFHFGQKYSCPMKATVTGPDGKERFVSMGSYGIGPSRLVAAVIEASHDQKGIIWPESLAPFDFALLNMRAGDADCQQMCEEILSVIQESGKDILYDDTDQSAGSKLATADLIGLPWQVIVGPRTVSQGMFELKNRKTGITEIISLNAFKTCFGMVG